MQITLRKLLKVNYTKKITIAILRRQAKKFVQIYTKYTYLALFPVIFNSLRKQQIFHDFHDRFSNTLFSMISMIVWEP